MAGKILDKFLGAVGFDIVDEAEEGASKTTGMVANSNDEEPKSTNEQIKEKQMKRNNVVNIHSQKQVKVIICKPTTYYEAQEITDFLKSHRQVILNLEETDKEIAKKIVDFVSGAIYALDGTIKKIGEGIFLCAPENIEVCDEALLAKKSKENYSWMN